LTNNLQGVQKQYQDRRSELSSLTENLRGVETTLGEKRGQLTDLQSSISDARDQFKTNQERMQDLDAQLATAEFEVNNARNRALASPNSFRDRRAAEEQIEGNPLDPVINQDVLSLVESANRKELTDESQAARDARIKSTLPVPDRANLTRGLEENFVEGVDRATDESRARGFATGLLSPFIEPAIDAYENYTEAKNINAANSELAESYGVDPAFAGEVTFQDVTSAAMARATDGLVGNENAGLAAVSGTKQAAPSRSNNRGGGNDEPYIPPVPAVPAPTQPSESEEAETGPYGGSLGNYSSYARRFFSRV
jgi:hypothetical protein